MDLRKAQRHLRLLPLRRRRRLVSHRQRPHRRHTALYRRRQRRENLRRIGTESPRRILRHLRALPARTLLHLEAQEAGEMVHPRMDGEDADRMWRRDRRDGKPDISPERRRHTRRHGSGCETTADVRRAIRRTPLRRPRLLCNICNSEEILGTPHRGGRQREGMVAQTPLIRRRTKRRT